MIISVPLTIAKVPRQCIHWQMLDKENTSYTYNRISFSIKKKGTPTILTTWMDPEDVMLSKISQIKMNEYGMIPFIG